MPPNRKPVQRYRQIVPGETFRSGMKISLAGRKGNISDSWDGDESCVEIIWDSGDTDTLGELDKYPALEVEDYPLILPLQLKSELLVAYDESKGDREKFLQFIDQYPEKP